MSSLFPLVPAKAGTQLSSKLLDSRFRENERNIYSAFKFACSMMAR